MGGLANLGITGINDVRIGKQINLVIEASNEMQAKEKPTKQLKNYWQMLLWKCMR